MGNKKIKIILTLAVMIILLPFLCLTVSANELSSDTIEIPRENCFFDKEYYGNDDDYEI